jgi:hypothetical protein
MHAIIDEPVFNQRIGKHNHKDTVGSGVSYSVSAEWIYRGSQLRIGCRELSSARMTEERW